MRASPRRPLILKRRKLSLPQSDAPHCTGTARHMGRGPPDLTQTLVTGPPDLSQALVTGPPELSPTLITGTPDLSRTLATGFAGPSDLSQTLITGPSGLRQILGTEVTGPTEQSSPGGCTEPAVPRIPAGIRVMGHPTMPDIQLVVIPPQADVQSVIQALTARGRESGGPNKFILISGGASCSIQAGPVSPQIKEEEIGSCQLAATSLHGQHPAENTIKAEKREGEELDISLTNIHWLGKMSSDGLGSCTVKEEPEEKENQTPDLDHVKVEADLDPLPPQQWQGSVSERPPYSYMALIQFAINSTHRKRMTLKEIYTWIEDHFPYFKYAAKPGWKNSIRHNLSLHDMFVRETSTNNKISHWTIHPEANRCLTLDQVFKHQHPDAASPMSPVCIEPQQKRLIPELTRSAQGGAVCSKASAPERKMKPLLPRISSYLVPVQFPVTQPVLLPASELFCADPGVSEGPRSSKRVKIAPKIILGSRGETPLGHKEAPALLPVKVEPLNPGSGSSPLLQRSREGGSRRKQQLILPCSEEPELVLPESSSSDSGLDTDFSFLQETQAHEGPSQFTQDEGSTFKTPVKERFLKTPASSTPSKPAEICTPQPWESETSLPRDPLLDFSPVRIPRGSSFTPFKDSLGLLSFGETPFKDLPFFDSPLELLGSRSPASPSTGILDSPSGPRPTRRCSKELQVGGPANRSLLEGLVLDTTDESLSKIMLDISFSGLEEDHGLGVDSVSWGQLLSELR